MAERRWHSALPLFVAFVVSLLLTTQPHAIPVLLADFIMASTFTAYMPTFWAIPSESLSPTIVTTAFGLVNACR